MRDNIKKNMHDYITILVKMDIYVKFVRFFMEVKAKNLGEVEEHGRIEQFILKITLARNWHATINQIVTGLHLKVLLIWKLKKHLKNRMNQTKKWMNESIVKQYLETCPKNATYDSSDSCDSILVALNSQLKEK